MTNLTLNNDQRQALIKIAKRTTDSKIAIKARVILALDKKDLTQTQIAQTFLLDETTILDWRNKFLNRADQADYQTWAKDSYLGDPGNLSNLQLKELETYVEEEIITNCLQVINFVSKNYGLVYSQSGILKILHKLDFTYKYTKQIPAKADPESQKQKWAELTELINNLTENERLGFLDAVHPIHNTDNQKCWVKKGQDKLIQTNTGRNRLNINGVIDLYSPDLEIISDLAETINSQNTIRLFDKIQTQALARNPNLTSFYLVCDNAKYYRSKLIQEYLNGPGCLIKLKFLTAYSPNLNLIERLWHYLRKKVIGVKYRPTFVEFKSDIVDFLDQGYQTVSQDIRTFIGTQPHFFEV